MAQIGTFGTMAARGAVRDTARALGHPYNIGDKIAKLIPIGSQGFPMTIDRALEITPELKGFYKKMNPQKRLLIWQKDRGQCETHFYTRRGCGNISN